MIKLVALSLAMAPFLVVVATSTLRASFDEVSSLGRTRPLVLEPLSLLRAQGPLTSPLSADRLEARKGRKRIDFWSSFSGHLERRAPQSSQSSTGGNGGGGGGNGDGFDPDPQKSLCLVANQVSTGAQQDGQDNPEPSQSSHPPF